MSKGLLFAIPIVLAAVLGLVLASVTPYAPWFAAGLLLVGIFVVAFYIRNQKHTEDNGPGKK